MLIINWVFIYKNNNVYPVAVRDSLNDVVSVLSATNPRQNNLYTVTCKSIIYNDSNSMGLQSSMH